MHNLRKRLFLLILIAGMYGQAAGQTIPDSVIRQYKSAKTDREKSNHIGRYFDKLRNDTLFFKKSATLIDFLKSVGDTLNLDYIQLGINDQLSKTGDYATALASTLEITNRFEQQKDKAKILAAYQALSAAYFYAGDKEKDLVYGKKALLIAKEFNDTFALANMANNISTSYSQKNIPDSALLYGRLSVSYARQSRGAYPVSFSLATLAEAFISDKQYDSALIYARESLAATFSKQDNLMKAWTLNDLSQIFLETNQYDSSKYFAHKAIEISAAFGFKDQLQRGYEYLSRSFNKTYKPDSAYKYLQLAVTIKDSLYSSDKTKQVQGVMAREQSRLQQIEKEKLDFQNKIRVYGLITGLVILAIIAFLLYRNNRQKQKANSNLQVQKEKVENTLYELKLTQQQLIHSEKMASLGELTAGIAHEIQNPLNFVNNFSEVNSELIEELKNEKSKVKSERDEELENELLNNIADNEKKINHHGKRADAIVKGMLQHSRSNSGVKESTDINALADEYLRLSYHGLRAKDNTFNATLKTDFDDTIGNINIIPQDIGRVLLNLYNNAFYAVSEKQKSPLTPKGGTGNTQDKEYEPAVTVSTAFIPPSGGGGAKIEIKVSDNGNGISQKSIDKIFQPFFTTKPTGQGTGLGLSLSYDVIKAHGGEIKVETKEGEGSKFIIELPLV